MCVLCSQSAATLDVIQLTRVNVQYVGYNRVCVLCSQSAATLDVIQLRTLNATHGSDRQQYFNEQSRQRMFDLLVTVLQFQKVLSALMKELY